MCLQENSKGTLSSVPCLLARSSICIRHISGLLLIVNPVDVASIPANINLIQNRKLAILTTLLLSIPLVTTQIKNMTYNESYIYKIK